MSSTLATEWLPTTAAAAALGCSAITLKRKRDINGGFLDPGVHYVFGSEANSAITWNVPAVRSAMHHRGMITRAAYHALSELRAG
jgi:hypothetical protein